MNLSCQDCVTSLPERQVPCLAATKVSLLPSWLPGELLIPEVHYFTSLKHWRKGHMCPSLKCLLNVRMVTL